MKRLLLMLLVCSVFSTSAQYDALVAANNSTTFNNTVFMNTDISAAPHAMARGGSCMNGYIVGSYVFGFAGGALIGWPVGTWAAGGDPEWYLAGIGAGAIGVAIVFEILGKKRCEGYVYKPQPTQGVYAVQDRGAVKVVSANGKLGFAFSL